MLRTNKRIDERLTLQRKSNGELKKRKEASLPPSNADEANKIFDELWEINPVLSLSCQMQSLTGLRYSDASWLKYDDFIASSGHYLEHFDVIQQKVFNMLMHDKYKNISEAQAVKSSTVRIYINDAIKDVVAECKAINAESEYLFSNKRSAYLDEENVRRERPMSVHSASEHHLNVQKKLKLDYPLGTHSWRKYFAKLLLDHNATVVDVRDLLGHSSLNSTNTYLQTFEDKLKPLIQKLSL